MNLIFAIAFVASPRCACAKEATQYRFNLMAGRLLPYGVYGVRNIYPFWGARFGLPFGGNQLELSSIFVHAGNVVYYGADLSVSSEVDLEGFVFVQSYGIDLHYYRGHTNLRKLPFTSIAGVHLGFSPLIEISTRLKLRTDFKFGINPGYTLFVGSGLEYSF